jgi:hypothetical protein
MGAGMVRVDRGDGKLFNFQPNDVDAFIKANPGAKRVDTPAVSTAPTEAELAATAALGIDHMTVAQLKEYADEHEIDLDRASVKADIIAAIKNAEASN